MKDDAKTEVQVCVTKGCINIPLTGTPMHELLPTGHFGLTFFSCFFLFLLFFWSICVYAFWCTWPWIAWTPSVCHVHQKLTSDRIRKWRYARHYVFFSSLSLSHSLSLSIFLSISFCRVSPPGSVCLQVIEVNETREPPSPRRHVPIKTRYIDCLFLY